MKGNKMHNEAPASVTYSLVSPNGFPMLFTLRGGSEAELIEIMTQAEGYLKDNGFTPKFGRSSYPAKKVEEKVYRTEPCPKCGGKVLVKQLKLKDGTPKTLEECENRVWDWQLKANTGTCDYQNWIEDTPTNTTDKPTSGQEKVLRAKGLWSDDLTQSDANDLLVESKG